MTRDRDADDEDCRTRLDREDSEMPSYTAAADETEYRTRKAASENTGLEPTGEDTAAKTETADVDEDTQLAAGDGKQFYRQRADEKDADDDDLVWRR